MPSGEALSGPDGPLVVRQERGRLEITPVAATAEPARQVPVEPGVHVLSQRPWHGVWQSGEVVVSIYAEAPAPSVAQIIALFPATGYDDGLPARVSRGWHTVTGARENP